jgi:uncharacterized protein (TIGR03067 family)
MIRTCAIGALIASVLTTAFGPGPAFADPPADAVKKELDKLQGTWQVVGVEENGMKIPDEKLRDAKATVTIEGDKHTLKYGGKSQGTVTMKIDPTTKPKQYDLVITEGAEKGKVQLGIYEADGDTFRLCLNKAGAAGRPTEFSAKDGSGLVVVTLKKEKPPADKK